MRKKNFYQLSSFSGISEQEIAMKDNAKLVSIHKESNFTKTKLMKQAPRSSNFSIVNANPQLPESAMQVE